MRWSGYSAFAAAVSPYCWARHWNQIVFALCTTSVSLTEPLDMGIVDSVNFNEKYLSLGGGTCYAALDV
jgi:hypothetical protein